MPMVTDFMFEAIIAVAIISEVPLLQEVKFKTAS